MDSKNRLRQELTELNLLVQGLKQVPGFPTDLLELISRKVASVASLIMERNLVSPVIEREGVVEDASPGQKQPEVVRVDSVLTVNDRFRFQRTFFENDVQKMKDAFSAIEEVSSVEEALTLMRTVCSVDEESDCFQDFSLMLHQFFAKKLSS